MKEKIIAILNEVLPGEDVAQSQTLADDGVIDSLTVVNLVTEFAIEFDIEVPFEELINENFNSVDAMAALIERLQQA